MKGQAVYAERAGYRKLITSAQRREIRKASRRAMPLGWIAGIAVVIISLVPWHNSEVATAHSTYHTVTGTIVQTPRGYHGLKGEPLTAITYRNWYGESREILFTAKKYLRPGSRETVVVSANDGAWIPSDSAVRMQDPRNPNIWTALLRGVAIGALGGGLLFGLLEWVIESWMVRAVRIDNPRAKQLMKERSTSPP